MATVKNITELPVAESADGLNLIVNDNGSAKQIAASAVGAQADWAETDETSPAFIKNKHVKTKELMYEWNFSADDEIYEIVENINDDDLMWLTSPAEGEDFEIVFSSYATYWDEETDSRVVLPEKIFTMTADSIFCNMASVEGIGVFNKPLMEGYVNSPWLYDNETGSEYHVDGYWSVYSGVHANYDDGSLASVDTGGFVYIESDGGTIKSVKIYKVTN